MWVPVLRHWIRVVTDSVLTNAGLRTEGATWMRHGGDLDLEMCRFMEYDHTTPTAAYMELTAHVERSVNVLLHAYISQ